jgi:hypothetical protein
VAAEPDRDPGHGRGPELRLGAAVHDHDDHHHSPTTSSDDRSDDHDGAAGASADNRSSRGAYDRGGRLRR